jgi:putative oxidoreductase
LYHRKVNEMTDDGKEAPPTALDIGLLILRFGLGVVFVAHGAQKTLGLFGGPGLAGTASAMAKMGIPIGMAYVASFTELLGGFAVLLGALTRLAALGLLVTMLVAMYQTAAVLGGGFFAPKGIEFPLSLSTIALALIVAGPGRFAVGDWEPRAFNLWRQRR